MKKKPQKPPGHLAPTTKKWWSQIVSDYALESQHLKILTLAAEAWDRAVEAREQLAKDGCIYHDRFGAPRKHPSVAIEEGARLAFARLLTVLDLEGEPNPSYRR